jgi:Mg2+-importing ATPase
VTLRKRQETPGSAGRFWVKPVSELFQTLQCDGNGLATEAASRRLRTYGPNEPTPRHSAGTAQELLRLLLSPLVVILLLAAGLSFALGDHVEAVIICGIVTISLTIDFVQTHRSATAARRLARLVATTAFVKRDGRYEEVPFAQLVPGDVIKLSAGDLVPADCRLLQSRFLSVNQAALTGESLPVDKAADGAASGDAAEAGNAIFLGSSVVGGTAEALVVHTGAATELGHIGRSLATRAPSNEFERGMSAFAALIARTVAFLVLFVFLVNAWFGRNPLESFLFAVALAVGLTPEFMPMIVSVTLAEGALRMARRRVIVKHLPAIQNLGAVDTLCSDKTGTLTEGTVRVVALTNPWRHDTGRLAELACVNAAFETGLRSPLDLAILGLPEQPSIAAWEKLDERPFDFVRRRVSVLARHSDGRRLLVTKGSPESVLDVCDYRLTDAGVRPMDAEDRSGALEAFAAESRLGHRSLAVAYREETCQPVTTDVDETGLVFAGLISFEDPPLPGVTETLAALQQQGVNLKILTGDDPLIAERVCAQVGLAINRVVTGPDVDQLSDPALGAVAEQVRLFARLTPAQKVRVILALKQRGHVVGFLGDGINDAPSLHAADVGISVAGAVDVAREAADIILLEKRLAVLLDGITEGRKSFGNIMKFIMMATSSNFGNMFSMAGATLVLPFLPLLPVQILLNNLLYDLSQLTIPSDAVDTELTATPKQWNMRLVRDFMLVFGPISSLFDYVTFGALWFIFHAQPDLFRAGWFVESLATQTLVIYVIRTVRAPWRSRPSPALVVSTLAALALGVLLPLTPAATALGFARPPVAIYPFLVGVVVIYLALVEFAKRLFFRHHSL